MAKRWAQIRIEQDLYELLFTAKNLHEREMKRSLSFNDFLKIMLLDIKELKIPSQGLPSPRQSP